MKRMMKKLAFLKNVRFSQRRALRAFGAIALCIVVYFFVVLPLIEATKKTDEEIALKKKIILKYEEYLRNRKAMEEALAQTLKQYDGVQQRLLPGETPQLGAASLQEIVKRLSEKNGIGVRSFRILEPKEVDGYRKIALQIDFNPTNSMLSLAQFIHDIEHHEKQLMITDMEFLMFNIRVANNVQGSFVIAGVMKGVKAKEKGRTG
jgi:type II secretory pathway component PulM